MSTQSFIVEALPRPGETVLASSLSIGARRQGRQSGGGGRAGRRLRAIRRRSRRQTRPPSGLRAHLRDNGVGLDGVVSAARAERAAAIVVDSAAENTIVVAPGANAHLTLDSADVQAVIADSDVCCCSWRSRRDRRRPRRRIAQCRRRDRDRQRLTRGSRSRTTCPRWRNGGRRRRGQRGRGARMALAGPAIW